MIEKLCKDVLDKLIFEFQKPDNREKINDNIINEEGRIADEKKRLKAK